MIAIVNTETYNTFKCIDCGFVLYVSKTDRRVRCACKGTRLHLLSVTEVFDMSVSRKDEIFLKALGIGI